jgi:hypothetical protein
MYYIALWVAPIFEMKAYMPEGSKGSGSAHYQIDTSAEVRILLYAKGARLNTDSGRKVKTPDLSSGATTNCTMGNYEKNWDASSGVCGT